MGDKLVFKYKSFSYLLWAILGAFGAHRLYLRRIKSGLAIAAYTIATSFFGIFLPTLFPDISYNRLEMLSIIMTLPVWAIMIYDLFNLHKWANQINRKHNPNMTLDRKFS